MLASALGVMLYVVGLFALGAREGTSSCARTSAGPCAAGAR
jgi:hypothetical protein